MPEATVDFLENQAIEVACSGFKRERTPEFEADVRAHIKSGLFFPCFNGTEEMIAFRIIDQPHPEVVYLAGAVKKPDSPRYLIRELTKIILNKLNPTYLVTRTQNDKVVDMLLELCGKVIPLNETSSPSDLEAAAIAGMSGFNEELIIPEYYGAPMIGDGSRPRSKNRRVRQFMDQLNYRAGDAQVLIGRRM